MFPVLLLSLLSRWEYEKSGDFFVITSTKIIGSPVLILSCVKVLLRIWNPVMTIHCLCPPSHKMEVRISPPPHSYYQVWPAPPPPLTALWEEFWWSNLTISIEISKKVFQFSLGCHTDQWLCCDSHSHLIIFISPFFIIPRERVSWLLFRLSLCLFFG